MITRYDDVKHTINYSSVCKAVMAYTEDSHHYTLESLATGKRNQQFRQSTFNSIRDREDLLHAVRS